MRSAAPGAAPAAPRLARPALELLVRAPEGEKPFVLKQVESSAALLRMRPRPPKGLVVETRIEDGATVLHVPTTGAYVRLDARETDLWCRMDGTATMQELATAWFFAYGSFDVQQLFGLLHRLRKAGLVELHRSTFLRSTLPEVVETEWRRTDVDAFFQASWRRCSFLRSRWVLATCGLAASVAYLAGWGNLGSADVPAWAWGAGMALAWVPLAVGHEFAHGLACAAHGRRVNAVGVSWRGAWVDTTDLFLSSRDAHARVAMAGPFASFVMGGAAAATALAFDVSGGLHAAASVVADAALLQVLVAGWPFLGIANDGQHALGDLRGAHARHEDFAGWRQLFGRGPRQSDLRWAVPAVLSWVALLVAVLLLRVR